MNRHSFRLASVVMLLAGSHTRAETKIDGMSGVIGIVDVQA